MNVNKCTTVEPINDVSLSLSLVDGTGPDIDYIVLTLSQRTNEEDSKAEAEGAREK
jgi:hypothetical protein